MAQSTGRAMMRRGRNRLGVRPMATLLSPEDAAKLRTYERERHNELAEG